MADLNLNQIQTRLNELFVSYGERKLIFWFDPKKEFEEDIDSGAINLDDAKLYKLEPHSQLLTKRFFELEDTENNYLVYAPFERMSDDDENNHLLSILKYSSLFSADRIALVMAQLEIPTDLHDVMSMYEKFFGAKPRIAAFEKLSSNGIRSKEELEMTLMAVLTKANTAQLYSILQALLVEFSSGGSELYAKLKTFNLEEVFWKYINKYYGYASEEPSISKLSIAFFANAFYGQLGHQGLPTNLKTYEVLEQSTAIISFMDGVVNDARYAAKFDKLSEDVFRLINGEQLLDKIAAEDLVNADIFEAVHGRIIKYYIKQLLAGDTTPVISNLSLEEVATRKMRSHFASFYEHQYQVLISAQQLLNFTLPTNISQFSVLVKEYEDNIYQFDQYYRQFIWHLDQVEDQDEFLDLQAVVEKNYKRTIDEMIHLWNDLLSFDERPSMLGFYDQYAQSKTKTVVIISDALRYEAAKEIQAVFQREKKYSTKMETIFSVLPSVTEFGKAASLKSAHESFDYLDGTDVRVSGMKSSGTDNRDKILKAKNQNSLAITYDDVIAKENAKELRELFNGQEVIYLYHDQIDKTGDHGQEKQVFDAVQKTIDELRKLLPRISNGANVYRFIITSDHGFIYTRSKVDEHEKIDNPSTDSEDRVERRFIISKNRYEEVGIGSVKLGDVLRNDDPRFVHFPETSAIFKVRGGGQSYVHGGSSPQEMLVPVLEIAVARGTSTKEPAQIKLMSTKRKVVGLSLTLEFYQTEPVSDSVTKSQYALYFEDGEGERISNEHAYHADSTSSASSERFTNFTFDFANRFYGSNKKVVLVIKDMETRVEMERQEFMIDNPFSGDFGFDI